MPKIAPHWVILAASLIYAGTAVWQYATRVGGGLQQGRNMPILPAPVAPPECKAMLHYTPGSFPQMMGKVARGADVSSVTVENPEGRHMVALTSATAIYKLGARQPAAQAKAEFDAFLAKMEVCRHATTTFMAPYGREKITLTPAALKKNTNVLVTLDDTVSATVLQAVDIMLVEKPKN